MKPSTIAILVTLALFAGLWIGAGLWTLASWRGVAAVAASLLLGAAQTAIQARRERAPP